MKRLPTDTEAWVELVVDAFADGIRTGWKMASMGVATAADLEEIIGEARDRFMLRRLGRKVKREEVQ